MLYTQYGAGTGAVVEADTSYCGVDGCMRMVLESIQNEHDTFNMLIAGDFAEAADRANGVYTESSYITEGVLSNIFQKVADFFKKILAKIKGIIKSIIDNIKMRFTKSGKELWNKYYKTVQSKMNKGDLRGMKFKYSKPTGKEPNDGWSDNLKDAYTELSAAKRSAENGGLADGEKYDPDSISNMRDTLAKGKRNDAAHPFTEDEKKDIKEEAFAKVVGSSGKISESEFASEMKDLMFEDEEEVDEFTESVFSDIRYYLTSLDKDIKLLEKEERTFEKACKDVIKQAEDVRKEMDKLQSSQKAGHYSVIAQGFASRAITLGNISQSVAAIALSTYTSISKKHQSQCRAIFIKAYNYKKKKSVDEAAMDDIIDDLCDYETDEMMNGTFTESFLF